MSEARRFSVLPGKSLDLKMDIGYKRNMNNHIQNNWCWWRVMAGS